MPAPPHPHLGDMPCHSDRSAQRGAEEPASLPRSFAHLLRPRLISVLTALAPLLTSCASPGPPRPPSLHLPDVVTDLTASRVGDQVRLHWTTPSRTTDGFSVPAPLAAEICRETNPAAPPPTTAKPATPAPKIATSQTAVQPATQTTPNCAIVLHLAVTPGPSETADLLPTPLTSDPVLPLAYRIRIVNPQNRSAGLSRPAIAAAGATPPPVAGFRATATRDGILLQWQPIPSPSVVEVQQTLIANPTRPRGKMLGVAGPPPTGFLLRSGGPRLSPAEPDRGGMLDRFTERGQTYTYRAQRIRTVTISGQTLDLRSELSSPVTLNLTDTFPPSIPTGLAAVPANSSAAATIDLSWQPAVDPDLAGYNVYRRTPAGSFERLNSAPVFAPAFSDTTVAAGTAYTYRITSVDTNGNESAPSAEVTETARTATNP